VFICNTVELARQQAVAVKKYTNFKVGFYVGEQGVDDWTRDQWTGEIRDHQVSISYINGVQGGGNDVSLWEQFHL